MVYGIQTERVKMPYKVLLCYGTRPEWIKIKPVVAAMKRSDKFIPTVLFTGQHKDIHGGDYDFYFESKELHLKNRLNEIISSQLMQSADWHNHDIILAQGDTGSVFATALQAFHHKVPFIHLEAGMRTHDMSDPYPEEGYRQMISRITGLHLCPTEQEKNNLLLEEIDSSSISVVGNTVLDNIAHLYPTRNNIVYITMHRRENEEYFEGYFREIVKLSELYPDLEFVFPMHPSEKVQKHRDIFENSRVQVVDPMEHNEFSIRLSNCYAVITDSGGVQEEAVFMSKPTIVCRRQMERNQCEGRMSFAVPYPEDISKTFSYALDNYDKFFVCPYGDGNSSSKVLESIEYYMENVR